MAAAFSTFRSSASTLRPSPRLPQPRSVTTAALPLKPGARDNCFNGIHTIYRAEDSALCRLRRGVYNDGAQRAAVPEMQS
jgi:hypothetical protein